MFNSVGYALSEALEVLTTRVLFFTQLYAWEYRFYPIQDFWDGAFKVDGIKTFEPRKKIVLWPCLLHNNGVEWNYWMNTIEDDLIPY